MAKGARVVAQMAQGEDEVYRMGVLARLRGARACVLADAVPPGPAPSGGVRLNGAALPHLDEFLRDLSAHSGGHATEGGSPDSFDVDAAEALEAARAAIAARLGGPVSISFSKDGRGSFPVKPGDAACEEDLSPRYGLTRGFLPAPNKSDCYLVGFVGKSEFRVLAYLDRFGRAFALTEPSAAPPARVPDVAFARFADRAFAPGCEEGCVQVSSGGTVRQVAQYRCERGRYTLFDSWYDFGEHASGLAYDEALARCFFAFSYRPQLGCPAVPTRGIESIFTCLREESPTEALFSIVGDVRAAEADPQLKAPALVRCFARWLEEAGAPGLVRFVGAENDPLRLVRTARFANTFYVAREESGASIPERTVWGIESALNRFLLVSEALGDDAALASDAECARLDALAREGVLAQALDGARPQPGGGEWEVRRRIGDAMERLRLPIRYEARFNADVQAGVVAFSLEVPGPSLMPLTQWSESAQAWTQVGEAERSQQALAYAQRVGLLLACAAFNASAQVGSVLVSASFAQAEATAYEAAFDRSLFGGEGATEKQVSSLAAALEDGLSGLFERAAEGFAQLAARIGIGPDDDFLEAAVGGATAQIRRDAPELIDAALDGEAARALGARSMQELRINADAPLRRVAERVAEAVVRAGSATEAIRCVRAEQARADDPRVYQACLDFMTALACGTVDATDQNAVVSCFVGEDRWLSAIGRARAESQHDVQRAIDILREAVAEAESDARIADNSEAVHRVFDSYASRVVYNRERSERAAGAAAQDAPSAAAPAASSVLLPRIEADAGKRVEVLPPSLVACYLELVRTLSDSFEHAEEAQRLGASCIRLAPTYSATYRITARAFMLVGDLESASALLKRCLEVATDPDEIAIAYYQLAYVEWKAGRGRVGAACYLKSMMTSMVYFAQCSVELHELIAEIDLPPIRRDDVDGELYAGGVPASPTPELIDAITEAARAAADANAFPVARSLLAVRLRHAPDDALANVLRSFGKPLG